MSDNNQSGAEPTAIRLACFGDSLMWGQGLRPEDKFAWRVWDALQPSGNVATMCRLAASSLMLRASAGAQIGATTRPALGRATRGSGIVDVVFGPRIVPRWLSPTLAGEITAAPPTVLEQIATFDGNAATIDLVLVNGGGNDIGVFWYMTPATSIAALKRRIEKVCYHDMCTLLLRVARQFPNACIVVPGYMQSLSPATATGVATGSGGVLLRLIGRLCRPVLNRVFERNRVFREETALQLRRAVHATAALVGEAELATRLAAGPDSGQAASAAATSNQRVIFADVDHFSQENAANGSDAWVWGIDTSPFMPQDPLRELRRGVCTRLGHWSSWYWASVGHPNPLGAQEIADGILRSLSAWSRHTTAPAADRLRAAIARAVERRALAGE